MPPSGHRLERNDGGRECCPQFCLAREIGSAHAGSRGRKATAGFVLGRKVEGSVDVLGLSSFQSGLRQHVLQYARLRQHKWNRRSGGGGGGSKIPMALTTTAD